MILPVSVMIIHSIAFNWLILSIPVSTPITKTEVAKASASSAFGANTVTLIIPWEG